MMKKKITKNIGLKILAFIISFFLWLVVVNYDDPVVSTTYSGIQVEVTNAESLYNKGKVYEIVNGTDNISVTLTGKRSVIESINKDNIRAVANLEDITLMDTVEIRVTTNKNYDQLDSVKSDTVSLELNIENLMEVHLPITVACEGSPQEGYVVGDISSNQNTVRVSGPESVVSTIDTAQCVISVNNRMSDISTTSEIEFIDANGNVVDNSELTTNIKSINVSVGVLPTKAVDIEYDYCGVPADGYVVNGDITGDRSAIYIAGKQSVLDSITSIVVPATAINVDDMSEPYSTVVNLYRYLPEGTRFADSEFDGNVAVNVDIEKTVVRALSIPMNNLSVVNVPEGYDAELFIGSEFTSTEGAAISLRVSVEGVQAAFTDVTGKDVTGYVDVAEYMRTTDRTTLAAGTYQMVISFDLPEGIELTSDYHADVRITAKE